MKAFTIDRYKNKDGGRGREPLDVEPTSKELQT